MEAILVWIVSGWDVIEKVCKWAYENPGAAAFVGMLINLIVAKIPRFGGYGKDVFDIIGKAVSAGMAARKGKIMLKSIIIFALCIGLCVACSTATMSPTGSNVNQTANLQKDSKTEVSLTGNVAVGTGTGTTYTGGTNSSGTGTDAGQNATASQ